VRYKSLHASRASIFLKMLFISSRWRLPRGRVNSIFMLLSVTAKKCFVVWLSALILISAGGAKAQVKPRDAEAASDWFLFLKTDGAPWEKKFEVTLDQTGSLNVIVQDPEKKDAAAPAKVAVKLFAKDAREIYDQAMKAFHEFRFPEEVADGMTLTLRITTRHTSFNVSARAPQSVSAPATLSMQIFHVGQQDIPEVDKLFALLNQHLAKEYQIY
jgi:hypothetical protein